MTTENVRAVQIGEIVVSDAPDDTLVAYGLGSCVAVCLYDPVTQVGGMLHALLPTALGKDGGAPTKFVDRGTPLLIESLLELGAGRNRLVAQLCGGARTLSAPGFESDWLSIGERNVQAAEDALQAAGLRIHAQATGGRVGRTVRFSIANGQVTIKSLGQGEQVLAQDIQTSRSKHETRLYSMQQETCYAQDNDRGR
jgi:chemotaxis protein CheD